MNLDSLPEITKLDSKNVLGSISSLPDQIKQAWEEIHEKKMPQECSLTKNTVIAGMGGSALGGRFVSHLFSDSARGSIEISTNFTLPNYVNAQTLVILSSYSGNTEETLSAFHDAQKKRAQIFGIATGGKLADLLKENSYPSYIFTPKHNPSNQPRMSLGYSITSILAVLSKCGFVSVTNEQIKKVLENTKELSENFDPRVEKNKNEAKLLAQKLKNKIAIFIGSEHLLGAIHAVKNQFNENAKTFSALFDIPELNHHLMEGLRNPAEAKRFLNFIFFESKHYSPQVLKRYPLTKDVVEKNDCETSFYKLTANSKLEEAFEVLVFGSYVGLYLALLYGIDPAPIPWVDYFKEKLT